MISVADNADDLSGYLHCISESKAVLRESCHRGLQTVPGREWMALRGCKAESVVPNYTETISGIPPDSTTCEGEAWAARRPWQAA
jgi:hypothetical protein